LLFAATAFGQVQDTTAVNAEPIHKAVTGYDVLNTPVAYADVWGIDTAQNVVFCDLYAVVDGDTVSVADDRFFFYEGSGKDIPFPV